MTNDSYTDPLHAEALNALHAGHPYPPSIARIQRVLAISYNRASDLMAAMIRRGEVLQAASPTQGVRYSLPQTLEAQDDALRAVGKWLNEEIAGEPPRQAIAELCAAQMYPAARAGPLGLSPYDDWLAAEHAIVNCLYQFIDRMNDVCPADTADQILEQFTQRVQPLLDANYEALRGTLAKHPPEVADEVEPADVPAQDMATEITRLRRDCAEAYQVIGAAMLGEPCAYAEHDVTRTLDNLSAAAAGLPRPHDDLLPWPSRGPGEAC